MLVVPFGGADHRQELSPAHFVEMIDLADNGFEVNVGLVDQLVPVEMVDGGEVFLADLGELLLELPFHLGNAPRLEGAEVVGDDLRAEGRHRVRHECP